MDTRLRELRARRPSPAGAVQPIAAAPPSATTPPRPSLGSVLLADVTDDLEAQLTAVMLALEPEGSLLLALEAYRIAPVPKAVGLLRTAQAAYPYRVTLRGHEAPVTSAQFSADGKTVLTASEDNTGLLWDSADSRPVEEVAREVARKVGRQLTDAERRRFGLSPAPSPAK